jgi:ATP-binding cassette subfamily F protein 3
LGASVIPGFLTQEQENLHPEDNSLLTLQRATSLPETDARAYLHKYLFANEEVFTPVKNLSWGQRVRLSLACLVAGGCNFLLLDEPLNHLDLPSRAQFERALADFSGTVLAVTHDRYFTARFANRLWQIADGQLTVTSTVLLDN